MIIEKRMLVRLALPALVSVLAAAGCKDTRNVGGEAGGSGAGSGIAAREAPHANPDLKHFPMPDVLPGQELVVGAAEIMPEIQKPATGGVCPVTVTVRGDTTEVTILSMSINCCTERVRPSVAVTGGVAEVRIWEYMTDVCECFFMRSVRFRLAPFDPEGLAFRIYANDHTTPCGEGAALAGSGMPD
ncbi:hypothetical protein KKG45_01845 [bacterium]|nr:hypothetical protein [bacterium]MBU1071969.1 hypothetical protein [bacterium]MBU1675629.1 hypothetical protein [bacterium]